MCEAGGEAGVDADFPGVGLGPIWGWTTSSLIVTTITIILILCPPGVLELEAGLPLEWMLTVQVWDIGTCWGWTTTSLIGYRLHQSHHHHRCHRDHHQPPLSPVVIIVVVVAITLLLLIHVCPPGLLEPQAGLPPEWMQIVQVWDIGSSWGWTTSSIIVITIPLPPPPPPPPRYHHRRLSPRWLKIEARLPLKWMRTVQVWDWDLLGLDDLISRHHRPPPPPLPFLVVISVVVCPQVCGAGGGAAAGVGADCSGEVFWGWTTSSVFVITALLLLLPFLVITIIVVVPPGVWSWRRGCRWSGC